MTTEVDVVNRALQKIGTRTTVTSLSEDSEEARQSSLVLASTRDELLRKAPWNCGRNYASLVYITSLPGTPENMTTGTTMWSKGIPAPPWLYEYQYPVDCLKPLYIIPHINTGSTGVPMFGAAITGNTPMYWSGPPMKYQVGIDQFYGVTAATKVAGGTNYAVGDQITLSTTPAGQAPIGAPAVLQVATLTGSAVATVTVVNQISGESPGITGSYFNRQTGTIAQSSSTGAGTGATFTLTHSPKGDQRVILTNQEFAILCYVRQVTDPNVMDPQFIEAWSALIGAKLAIQLTGEKNNANIAISMANELIMAARVGDGNEGLTINDVLPDWIRIRGIQLPNWEYSPGSMTYDWGPLFNPY